MAEELTNEICALKEKISKLEERRDLSSTEKEERVAITNEITAHSNEIAIIRQQIIRQGNLSFMHVRSETNLPIISVLSS